MKGDKYMTKNGGKTAAVTGANRGLGLAVVKKLAENGYDVWACARTANDSFENELSLLSSKYSVAVRPLYFDVTNEEAAAEAFKTIKNVSGRLDVLVNNAGIGHMGYVQMIKSEQLKRIFEVNTIAPILLSRMAIPLMRKNRYGRIINISSTAAEEVYTGNAIYGGSKAALNMFTRAFASEVCALGITVNAIAPGLIDTDMSSVFEGNAPEKPMEHSALGRKIVPEEIAAIIIKLLDDDMSLINGEVIMANGGHK